MSEYQPSIEAAEIFRPRPLLMFAISLLAIFIAEAVVMMVLPALPLNNLYVIAFVDAILLSIIVVPLLYFFLFRPMDMSIQELDKSEQVQRQLAEVDQLKSDFISIAAHELCHPVTTIANYAEIIQSGVTPEQQQSYLAVIIERTQALERIIEDLSVIRQIEMGENLTIEKVERDLIRTMEHVINDYRTRLPDKPIRFSHPEGPVLLAYDEVRIGQVLDNLMSNAVKYDNDMHDEIDVSLRVHDNHVVIQIRDEGIGMTDEELKLIYRKFFRAKPKKTYVEGLGLGMTIVKNIIEGHGGRIDIASQTKVGTTVTITLPQSGPSPPAFQQVKTIR